MTEKSCSMSWCQQPRVEAHAYCAKHLPTARKAAGVAGVVTLVAVAAIIAYLLKGNGNASNGVAADSYSPACDAACLASYGVDTETLPSPDATDYGDLTNDPVPGYTDGPAYTDEPDITYEPDPPVGKVTYKVTGGSSTSLITYTTEDGTIEQNTTARLPWKKKVGGDGDFYQVSAQDTGGAGKITCQIIGPDGEVLSKHTSRGPYSIASCMSS